MIARSIIVTVILLITPSTFSSTDPMLSTVSQAGIPIECHYVTTDDGYILRLYHIPPPVSTEPTISKSILLMHGLQSSSLDYVFYPNSSAAYYFHRHGFDVYIGNARGNRFSRNHTTIDPNNPKFWRFSWHEIGIYDLKAMVDFILSHSKQTQLIYAGHSQGGTIIFVLLSERPEYNEKIASVHVMGPAVYFKYPHPLLIPILDNIDPVKIKALIEEIELFEWNSYRSGAKVGKLLGDLCINPFMADICRFIIGRIFGSYSSSSYYDELILDYASINPSGSSYMQYIHFAQLHKSGRFHQFDYGKSANMRLYKSPKPPEYNLSNVQTKVHIIFGTDDFLVRQENMPILISNLNGSVVAVDRINSFNHLDFVMGRLVHYTHPLILQVINKFA